MRIRIDSERIKSERDRRAWSQAHLAEVSGLGLRTIQRIEKTGFASAESIKALASVFELEVSDLRIEQESASPYEGVTKGAKPNLFYFALFWGSGTFAGTLLYGFLANGLGLERFEVGRAIFVGLFVFFFTSVLFALVRPLQREIDQLSSRR